MLSSGMWRILDRRTDKELWDDAQKIIKSSKGETKLKLYKQILVPMLI